MSETARGFGWGILGIVIFGLTLPSTRLAVAELDPLFVSIGRTVIAAIVAIPILLFAKAPWPDRRTVAKLVITAAGVVIGFPVFSAIAMQWAPASHGAVVLGALPIATAMMGIFIAGERPSLRFWLWSLAGSAAVISFALWNSGDELHRADILLVLAVLSASAGYALGGELSRRLGGWQVICWALVIALPLTLPIFLWLVSGTRLSASYPAWTGFLYLALMSQLVGFFAWNKGLALGGIAKVGQVQLLQIFVTILASALLLGEHVTLRTLIFALIVTLCVWQASRAKVRRLNQAMSSSLQDPELTRQKGIP
jgi:drug/metabolite transporter (DMT)-like permease